MLKKNYCVSLLLLGLGGYCGSSDAKDVGIVINSPNGSVIEVIDISTRSNYKIQIPSIKNLTNADPIKVKENILKENKYIRGKIKNITNAKGYSSIEIKPKIVWDDSEYLSIAIDKIYSNATERYFTWNMVIDKRLGKHLTVQQVLQSARITLPFALEQINYWVLPCRSKDRGSLPERCSDVALDSFAQYYDTDETAHLIPSGVYLKNGLIGLSFDSSKFTTTFELDLKTKKIINGSADFQH